jgi:RNA polymerase sigma-70 factor (ECF subfamily)
MLEDLDNPDFIAKLMAGDEDANEKLYKLATSKLWARFTKKWKFLPQDGEDLIILTFQKFHQSLHRTYDPEQGLIGWLLAIAERVAIDHFRELKSRDEAQIDNESDIPCDNAAEVNYEGNYYLSPDGLFVQQEFDKLNASDRRVILLRVKDGMKFKEIGEIVGKAEKSVNKQYNRAIEKLREGIKRARLDE